MTIGTYFLWPKAKAIGVSEYITNAPSNADIETWLHEYYQKSAYPVLYSSGRAGIYSILQHEGLSRPDIVWCPAYSSHCVFDAISRLATPSTIYDQTQKPKVALLYHQWGHPVQNCFDEDVLVIEDAADTLFMKQANLFQAGGKYTLVSLPKIIGSMFGGVVFCKLEEDAKHMRALRDERSSSFWHSVYRTRAVKSKQSALLWNGVEAAQGTLLWYARSQILSKLKNIDSIVEDRLQAALSISQNLHDVIQKNQMIPSNIPLNPLTVKEELWRGERAVFSAGYRNFNGNKSAPDTCWSSSAPLPFHIDVTKEQIRDIKSLLSWGEVKDIVGVIQGT